MKLFILMSMISLNVFAEFLPSSFSANFTQEYISSLKGKLKKGNGAIDYKYPSNIRFETNNPTHVLYVTNGTTAWYYSFPFIEGEEGELTETSAKNGSGLFTKFFDSLKNGLNSNSMYEVAKDNNNFKITFKEKSAKVVGIKTAKLIFEGTKAEFTNLKTIELEFLDSKKSTLNLMNLKVNQKIEEGRFTFVAPKNTKKVPQKN